MFSAAKIHCFCQKTTINETKYLKKVDHLPIFFLYFIFFKQLFFCHFFGQNVPRFLTKSSALMITKHPEIPPALLHFVNVVLSILVCILLYKTLQKLSPKLCKVLGSRA